MPARYGQLRGAAAATSTGVARQRFDLGNDRNIERVRLVELGDSDSAPPVGRVAPRRTRETPEFQRQNREFAAAVETAGKPVRLPPRFSAKRLEQRQDWRIPENMIGVQS